MMLFAIATPISIGMLIRNKRPEWAKTLVRVIQPLSLFLIVAGLIFGVYTSRYIQYGPKAGYILAVLLPLITFVISATVCILCKISWAMTKAVTFESGMKNTLLGVAVIELSFPQPQADLASILIIMVTIGQTTLSLFLYLFYIIHSKCCIKGVKTTSKEDGHPLQSNSQESESFLSNWSQEYAQENESFL